MPKFIIYHEDNTGTKISLENIHTNTHKEAAKFFVYYLDEIFYNYLIKNDCEYLEITVIDEQNVRKNFRVDSNVKIDFKLTELK